MKNADGSIGLGKFSKLSDAEATFVWAQRDVSRADAEPLRERLEVLAFGDALNDFAEAAALISRLDLLITVNSSIAHLTGALGKTGSGSCCAIRPIDAASSIARIAAGTRRLAYSGKAQTVIGTMLWSGSGRSCESSLKQTAGARCSLPGP